MKSFLALALLVGVALSNSTSYYGWTPDHELRFRYESELLTGLPDIKHSQWAGVKIASDVVVQTFHDYTIRVRFVDPRMKVFNREDLPVFHGRPVAPEATEEMPQQFKAHLEKPFEAHMRRGVIEKSFYGGDVPAEVVNIQKALLSQLQMDLTGSGRGYLIEGNFVPGGDPANVPPLSTDEETFFSTLESTIDGECQTDYTFVPMTKFQSRNLNMGEEIEREEQQQEGLFHQGRTVRTGEEICRGKQYYEIVKTRNYNNCVRRPIFQISTGIHHTCDASKGDCKDLLAHVSTTRYVVCGQRDQFYIREIVTDDQIQTNPLGWNTTPEKMKQLTRVVLTIQEVKRSGFSPMPRPSSPKERETLSFEYSTGQHDYIPEKKLTYEEVINPGNTSYIHPIRRMPDLHSDSNIQPAIVKFDDLKQKFVPELTKAVRNFFHLSQSCSGKKDVSGILSILADNIRPHGYHKIKELERMVKSATYENEEQKKLAIVLFYDVIALSGSNPSLMVIKDIIESGSSDLPVSQKSKLIMTSLRSTFTPTEELMRTMFQLIKDQKRSQTTKPIYTSGLISITNLVYRACIDPMTSFTGFPVRIYGKFCSKDSGHSHFITDELIPYLTSELEDCIRSNDETTKLVLISSLGKLGHKKVLIPLTKVIESTSESPMTRSLAVSSLRRLARREPTLTRRILLAMIDNPAEQTAVRISAISVLPYTQPSVTELQKMAIRSWFEPSKQVGSFMYSTLKSLVKTEDPELKNVGQRAKTLIHLVKPFQTGLMFSQNIQSNNYVRYLMAASTGEFSYINSEESIAPTRVSVGNGLFGSTWRVDGLTFTTYTHGMDKLWNKILNSVGLYNKVSHESKEKLEKIDREIGLVKNRIESKPHGLFQIKSADFETMMPFSHEDYEKVIEEVTKVIRTPIGSASSGEKHLQSANFHAFINLEVMGFTQSGLPLYARRTVPVVYGIKGVVKTMSEYGSRSEIEATAFPILNYKFFGAAGVIVPFTGEYVGCSVEMNLHAAMPVSGRIVVDKKEGKIDTSLKMVEYPTSGTSSGEVEVFHYYTKPYTFRHHLRSLEPLAKSFNVLDVYSGEPRKHFEIPVGRSLGIESTFHVDSDYKHLDFPSFINRLRDHNLVSFLSLGPMVPSVRQNSFKYTINIAGSSTRQIETTFSMVSGMKSSSVEPKVKSILCESHSVLPWEKKPIEEKKEELKHKCQQKHQGSYEVEKCVEKEVKRIEGQKKVTEELKKELKKVGEGSTGHGICVETAVVGSSGTDRKVYKTIVVGVKEKLNPTDTKYVLNVLLKNPRSSSTTYSVKSEIVSKMPKVLYRWDVNSLINSEIKLETEARIRYGHGEQPQQQVELSAILEKDERLKTSLRNSEEYQKCRDEMSEERKLASVCEELRHQAASINKVHFHLRLPGQLDRSPVVVRAEHFLRSLVLTNIFHLTPNERSEQGLYEIEARVNRHGDQSDLVMRTPQFKFLLEQVRVPGPVVPLVPFSLRNPIWMRLLQKMTRDQSPTSCRLNERWVSTFDNRTYEYDLTSSGCKVLLYKDCDEKKVNKPVSVSAEKGSSYLRNIEFVSGEDVILLERQSSQPHIGGKVDIKVNHQLISLNAGHYYIKKDHATGNVNLVIYRYVDNVVLAYNPELFVGVFYDGRDAEVVTDQLLNKNRACGLCGDNNGEYNTDVRTPRHCVMSEPRLGAYSYVLDNKVDRCLSQDDLRKYRHEIGNCEYKQTFIPTPVEKIARILLSRLYHSEGALSSSPLSHLIDETPNFICISKRPVGTCPRRKTPTDNMPLEVEMVCLPRFWPSAQQMASRAAEGEVLLELARLRSTFTQRVFVPTECSGGGHGPYDPTSGYRATPPEY